MPPPRYPTPANTFGIAKKPLEQWFDATTSGYERTGPAFSNEIEDALIRNDQRALDQERLRRQLESEAAASAFMAKAAGQNPQGLMRMIADDPAILGSEGFGQIRDYVALRQELEPPPVEQPFSNKSLAPAIMSKLPPEDQFRMQKYLDKGVPAYDAFEMVTQENQKAAMQQGYQKRAIELIEMGADPEEVAAASKAPNPDVAFAMIKGKLARGAATGKGAASGDVDQLKQAEQLLKLIESAEMGGASPKVVETLKKRFEDLFTEAPPPTAATDDPNLSTGAGGAATDTTKTQPPAIPKLPPAPPATALEEEAAKAKAQAGVTDEQKKKLANAVWTGLKGEMYGDRIQAPAVIMREAQAAIVGGETTNARAKKIAALARAHADGRRVDTTEEVRENFDPKGRIINMRIRIEPAEALVRELGYKRDDIIGQAPTRPGGPMRNITALEAARAILEETAVPFLKLKEGVKVATEDSDEDPLIEAALEKARTGGTKKD